MLPVNLLNSQVKKRKSSLKIMQNINFFTDFYAARTKGKHFLSNVFHEYLFRYNQNVSKDGRTNVKFHKNTEMCIDLIVIKSYKNLLSSDGEYGGSVKFTCICLLFSDSNCVNTVDYGCIYNVFRVTFFITQIMAPKTVRTLTILNKIYLCSLIKSKVS